MVKVYKNISQVLTLENSFKKNGKRLLPEDLTIINNGSIAFNDKEILWVGKTNDLPKEFQECESTSLEGFVVTPEIVDSHTHLVFGGDRSEEYAERLNGTSYEEIAKRGGGILFSSKHTNEASENELFETAVQRIEQIFSYGVGTIEIKSGYGLNYEKELQLSLIIDRLKKHFAPRVQIFNTFLAAHDVPKKFNNSKEYLLEVVIPLLHHLAPLQIIDAVDIFHEKNYFTDEDVNQLFKTARQLGIPTKMHADELNDNQGAILGVQHKSLSVDHLLKVSNESIEALARSETIATLLPGTAFFLGKPLAPARQLLNAGVSVAIASDFNPGSCHCDNLLLVASISAAQLKLNQTELWSAITLNAAKSLGLNLQGAIMQGMKPRFSIFQTDKISKIIYNWGKNFAVTKFF
jgi:imidazolonepropionase